jgi:hypothetical protein
MQIDRRVSRTLNIGTVLLIGALLIALSAFALIASTTRYYADDYCQAVDSSTRTLWYYVDSYYRGFSGRFSFFAAFWFAQKAGMIFAPIWSVTSIALWSVVTFFASLAMMRLTQAQNPKRGALILSLLLVWAMLQGVPDVDESFFWLTGNLVYTVPMIFFTAFLVSLGWVVLGRMGLAAGSVLAAILCFIAGAFSDIFVGLQPAALGLMWLAALVSFWRARSDYSRRAFIVLSVALVFASASSLIVLVAPGNEYRRALFPHTMPLSEIPWRAFRSSIGISLNLLRTQWMLLVALFAAPFLLGLTATRKISLRSVALCLAAAYVLLLIACAAAYYSTTTPPIGRTLSVPLYFIFVALIVTGFGAGSLVQTKLQAHNVARVALIAAILISIAPLWSAYRVANQIPASQDRAAKWDARDKFIRAERQRLGANQSLYNIRLIESPRKFGVIKNDDFNENWVRDCAARYYGFYNFYLY